MFRKIDRQRAERIETALTTLRLDIGVRDVGITPGPSPTVHQRLKDVLSKLGALEHGMDKLMQSHSALEKAQDTHHLNFNQRLGEIEKKLMQLHLDLVAKPRRVKPPSKSRKK